MSDAPLHRESESARPHLPWFGIPALIPFLKPFRRPMTLMVTLCLTGGCLDICLPLFQRYAIDHFIAGETLDTLPAFIALYLLFITGSFVLNYGAFYRAFFMEMNVSLELRRAAFNHLQTLSFSFFNRNSVGYIHSRVMSDTERISSLVSWHVMEALWTVIFMFGALAIMFSIHWKLALGVSLVLPVAAVVIVLFQRALFHVNKKIRELNSRITGDFNEGITGARTIKTLVAEDRVCGDFRKDTHAMKRASVLGMHYRALFASAVSFASSLALAIVLWRGGLLSREGVMEIGTLSVFMSYAISMMEPFFWVSSAISELIAAQVNIERFSRLVNAASDVADTPEVVAKYGDAFHPRRENWEPLYGEVEFRDVSFRYPDGDETILEHFNLKVPQGANVALVGETGAGKSTLVNLVCRFFEPTAGQILVDGRDVRERSQLWLHSHIGYVLQTPYLFSGTVRENLLYGNPDATEEQIALAVRRVSADRVIARMGNGLDSQVGECGDLLSTGEKQLISFARAILADPRILVLDEATSSVDTMTEKMIQDAIGEVTRGRTSFVIAHRLSTIRSADLILVMKDGRVVESGTHEALMRARGYYHSLYTKQFELEAVKDLSI
jgi:ATP-binding cassette subfamily B protein